jgi:hypothetical protein
MIWTPESLYLKTLSYSGLLLTIALLFYHMTKAKTLEMNSTASGLFAVIIIIISIIYLCLGTYTYFLRLQHLIQYHDNEKDRYAIQLEQSNRYTFFTLGIILMCVQLGIIYQIIIGIFY